MKFNDIIIDTAATTGGKFIATGIRPSFAYNRGVKSDNKNGVYVDCILPNRAYSRLTVRLPSDTIVGEEILNKEVTFNGFDIHAYVIEGRGIVSARADAVKLAK